MMTYWLTPLIKLDPLILGAARIRCDDWTLTDFRAQLQTIHPRCLMVFKAKTLITDDLDSCGADKLPFLLESQQDIVFDGINLILSHCADAFLERLPSIQEVGHWLHDTDVKWSDLQLEWIKMIHNWHNRNYHVILIKED